MYYAEIRDSDGWVSSVSEGPRVPDKGKDGHHFVVLDSLREVAGKRLVAGEFIAMPPKEPE